MNILMILNQKFPPDIRVEKEIKVLSKKHNIMLSAGKVGNGSPILPARSIIRLPVNNWWVNFQVTAFHRAPKQEKALLEKLENFKPDVVHVHDLFWSRFGIRIAKTFRAKVVLDFHENLPAAFQCRRLEYQSIFRHLPRRIAYNPKRWRKFEKMVVEEADFVILVVHEAQERFLKFGFSAEKFEIVGNTEMASDWAPAPFPIEQGVFRILYLGGGGIHRGIDTLIQAIDFIPEKEIKIQIVGVDPRTVFGKKIATLRNSLKNKERVEFLNWVPFGQVPHFIERASLCAVPHNRFEHTDTTVPHKLFQYMAMEKAVLVSDVQPLERIVSETQSGFIFSAGDPKDCAEKILEASHSSDLLNQMGKRGRKAVEGPYSWEVDAKRLERLYEKLEMKDPPTSPLGGV